MKTKKTCNKCGGKMILKAYEFTEWNVCTNSLCPNDGLIQIPAEDMLKEKNEL